MRTGATRSHAQALLQCRTWRGPEWSSRTCGAEGGVETTRPRPALQSQTSRRAFAPAFPRVLFLPSLSRVRFFDRVDPRRSPERSLQTAVVSGERPGGSVGRRIAISNDEAYGFRQAGGGQ